MLEPATWEYEQIERQTRSSIEIDQNAKGDWSLKAKIAFDEADPEGAHGAIGQLEHINDWFQRRFRGVPGLLTPGESDLRD